MPLEYVGSWAVSRRGETLVNLPNSMIYMFLLHPICRIAHSEKFSKIYLFFERLERKFSEMSSEHKSLPYNEVLKRLNFSELETRRMRGI